MSLEESRWQSHVLIGPCAGLLEEHAGQRRVQWFTRCVFRSKCDERLACLLLLVASFVVFPASTIRKGYAQQVLFDNTEFNLGEGERIYTTRDEIGGLVAQPFIMDDSGSIGSVRVAWARTLGDNGGIIPVSIWSDDGNGKPGEFVAEVGIIDFGQLARFDSVPTMIPTTDFGTQITGLTPGSTYFVHFDLADVELGPGNIREPNLLINAARRANDGTNGAGCLQIKQPPMLPRWTTVDTFFPGRCYFQMAVESLSTAGVDALLAGDADQDLDFDQMDLVQVQVAAKYLAEETATWGEGDWDGAPGGSAGNPPAGDGLFDQLDVIASLGAGTYLTGPYAAIQSSGKRGDAQTSVIYYAGTGELAVDAPAGAELTSINIDSATGIFAGSAAENLGGSFDNDADANIFKATFGSSFGSLNFGNVAQAGLTEKFVLGDLSVIGSLAGGGDLGAVDLVYVPEPTSVLLLSVGLAFGALHVGRNDRKD